MAQVTTKRAYGRPWIPRADIYETKEHVVILLDIPGIKPDDIDVQCEKGMLSIKGERPFRGEGTDQKYYRVENIYGPFERYFDIPGTLNISQVEAVYQNGVLSLTFPKTEAVKPRKISITIN